MNLQNLESSVKSFEEKLQNVKTKHDVLNIKSDVNSLFQSFFKEMKSLSMEQKKIAGELINKLKTEFETKTSLSLESINRKEIEAILEKEGVDITMPSFNQKSGSLHPISFTTNELITILEKYGFTCVKGPEIETCYYNFDALNIQKNHPARDMHDTFYLNFLDENSENFLLRTHTSTGQIRVMENTKPPISIISTGRTYRNDFDKTHTPMFNQLECLMIGKGVNMGNLMWLINRMFDEFFAGIKVEVRMRPSFFPFTEPSAEIDINIGNGFLEVMGAGMVHPNVLKNCGIDSNIYSGFAFGTGIERLAMLKYGIEDLRDFFHSNYKWSKCYEFRA